MNTTSLLHEEEENSLLVFASIQVKECDVHSSLKHNLIGCQGNYDSLHQTQVAGELLQSRPVLHCKAHSYISPAITKVSLINNQLIYK
jgi:hypothetical protein